MQCVVVCEWGCEGGRVGGREFKCSVLYNVSGDVRVGGWEGVSL